MFAICHVTWRTIRIPDILDHKLFFPLRFSDHHSNTRPFDNRTQIYHWNTGLVQFSDGYFSQLFIVSGQKDKTHLKLKIHFCLVPYMTIKYEQWQISIQLS